MKRWRVGISLVAAFVALFVGGSIIGASAAEMPTDAERLTAYLAKAFSDVLPGATVTIKAQLQLEVSVTPGAGAEQVYLDKVFSYCQRQPANCEWAAKDFVARYSAMIKDGKVVIRRSAIRAVVRPASYVDRARHQFPGKPDWQPVVEPLAGDFWLVCVLDQPNGITILNFEHLRKLDLSAKQAIALAKENLHAALAPIKTVTREVPQTRFKFVHGDYYDSSRLLLHEDWAEIAKKMKGSLVVAAPAVDLIIYGNGARRTSLAKLGALAEKAVNDAIRPVSPTLLKWTPAGWEVVNP